MMIISESGHYLTWHTDGTPRILLLAIFDVKFISFRPNSIIEAVNEKMLTECKLHEGAHTVLKKRANSVFPFPCGYKYSDGMRLMDTSFNQSLQQYRRSIT